MVVLSGVHAMDRARSGPGTGRAATLAVWWLGALSLLAAGCSSITDNVNDMLEGLTAPSPAEAARWAVDPHDPDKRRRGTNLLANAPFGGAEPYLNLYRDRVQHEPNPLVRAEVVRALARHGGPEDAPLLAPLLEHESPIVRWEAAKGLQRLHNDQVVVDLLRALRREEEQTQVRVATARALGQYAEPRVFQALVGALGAHDLSLNRAAAQSLRTLTGASLDLDDRAWLAWYAQAEAQGDPFARQQEYLFPTYQRNRSLLEWLVFWNQPVFEEPAPPAGLRPESERRTYPDSDAPDGGAGG